MAQGASADGRVIDQAMLTCLVMAGEAVGGVAGGDYLLDGYAGTCFGLAGFVVTAGAGVLMRSEDAGPVVSELGVADIAILTKGLVDAVSLADRMDMAVAGKGAGVAGAAFAGGGLGRADAETGAWAMAGGAAQGAMHLGWRAADER